jgi:FMN reductase
MSQIVIISGSPTVASRINLVLKYVENLLNEKGLSTTNYSVTEFSPEDLVKGRWDSQDIAKFAEAIKQADGVIIGSPVYKASYTGVLKSLLDLLPEGAFKHTPVLPIMVGGSTRHLLAIDYSLNPLIAILKGQPLQGLYFVDSEIDKTNEAEPIKDEELLERIQDQVGELIGAVDRIKSVE